MPVDVREFQRKHRAQPKRHEQQLLIGWPFDGEHIFIAAANDEFDTGRAVDAVPLLRENSRIYFRR